MPDSKIGKVGKSRGRHQARKRAVDLLFEAEARGLTAAEVGRRAQPRWRRPNRKSTR